MRHYMLQDQCRELEDKRRNMDGLQIMLYSIVNASIVNRKKNDWLTFFKHAVSMTEEQVHEIRN